MAENLSHHARDLSNEDLEEIFDVRTVERGRGYSRDGRVESISDDDQIVARVRGNGRSYLVVIEDLDPFEGQCTCPVGHLCKHMVATLLVLGAGGDMGWRGLLTAITAQRRPNGVSLGLGLGTRHDGVPLTPYRRSGERWVKMPWPDLMNSSWQSTTDGLNGEQVAVLRHLHRTARRTRPWNSPSDILLSDLGAEAVSFLRQVASSGMTVLDPDMQAVELADDAWHVRLEIEGETDLTARPVAARPDGIRAYALPGVVPAIALSQGRIAPVDTAVPTQIHSMIAAKSSIHVDDADRLEFEADFIPALGAVELHSPDGSFSPTEFTEPRLHLHVTRAGPAFRLEWRQARRAAGHAEPLITDLGVRLDEDAAIVDTFWREAGLPSQGAIPAPRQIGPEHLGAFREIFVPALEEHGIGVTFGERGDITFVNSAPELKVNAASERDWLDLALTVEVEGHSVPLPVLYAALVGGQPYLEFGDILIKLGAEFDQLRALLREAAMLGRIRGKTISVPTPQAHALSLPDDLLEGILADRLSRLDRLAEPVAVPQGLEGTLRPYQVSGFSWLARLAEARYGGILADDMGLGKTIQILAALAHLKETGQLAGPVLIVAPTSVVSTWANEAARFTPGLTVRTVDATRKKRRIGLAEMAGADIIVTSYTLLRLEGEEYGDIQWTGLVLDEAQAVKNPRTVGYRAIMSLDREWAFAVTGTPVENTIGDLAALFALVSPGLLPGSERFAEKFRRPIERTGDPAARALLRKLTKPFLMRRRKDDVARDLPEKVSTVLSVPMDEAHERRYIKQLERERQEVLGLIRDPDGNRISILASLTRLRRLAIDPGLLEARKTPAAKTEVLMEHLQSLLPSGHQVLVFSQFTSYLARIAEQLEKKKIPYAYLDGATRNRDRAIDSFKSGQNPVFLISLKAGGVGLTLIEADYVFVMDPWWNPAAEEQAIDRAHRIGQDKHVHVYRLTSAGTIEEKVLALQERKRKLAGFIDEGAGSQISADDIRALLEA